MKKIKLSILAILFLMCLNACSSVKSGLAGNKEKTSDEFLVEKKSPLVLPPSYGKLPEPKKATDNTESQKGNFNLEELVNKDSSKNEEKSENNSNETIESSIIKKIKNK